MSHTTSHVVDLKTAAGKTARGKADQLTSAVSLQYLKQHDVPVNINKILLKVLADRPTDPLAMIERELREVARQRKQQSIIQHSSAQVYPAPNTTSGPFTAPPPPTAVASQKKKDGVVERSVAPTTHKPSSSTERKPSVVEVVKPLPRTEPSNGDTSIGNINRAAEVEAPPPAAAADGNGALSNDAAPDASAATISGDAAEGLGLAAPSQEETVGVSSAQHNGRDEGDAPTSTGAAEPPPSVPPQEDEEHALDEPASSQQQQQRSSGEGNAASPPSLSDGMEPAQDAVSAPTDDAAATASSHAPQEDDAAVS